MKQTQKRIKLSAPTGLGADCTEAQNLTFAADGSLRVRPARVRHSVYSGAVNGLFAYAGDGTNEMLIHSGTDLIKDGAYLCRDMKNAPSTATQIGDRLYILDGLCARVYDGESLYKLRDIAHIPTLVGEVSESANAATPYRYEEFTKQNDADNEYRLTCAPVADISVEYYEDGAWYPLPSYLYNEDTQRGVVAFDEGAITDIERFRVKYRTLDSDCAVEEFDFSSQKAQDVVTFTLADAPEGRVAIYIEGGNGDETPRWYELDYISTKDVYAETVHDKVTIDGKTYNYLVTSYEEIYYSNYIAMNGRTLTVTTPYAFMHTTASWLTDLYYDAANDERRCVTAHEYARNFTGRIRVVYQKAAQPRSALDRCRTCHVFGEDIFFASNPARPATDWRLAPHEKIYAPESLATTFGTDKGEIVGCLRLADGTQAIFKRENGVSPSVYYRSVSDEGYLVRAGAAGVGAVSHRGFATHEGDALFASKGGIYRLVAVANITTDERYGQAVSSALSGVDMSDAILCSHGGILYLAADGRVFVAKDYRWLTWDMAATALLSLDGALYLGDKNGFVWRLDESLGVENSMPIKAHFTLAPIDFGTRLYRKNLINAAILGDKVESVFFKTESDTVWQELSHLPRTVETLSLKICAEGTLDFDCAEIEYTLGGKIRRGL